MVTCLLLRGGISALTAGFNLLNIPDSYRTNYYEAASLPYCGNLPDTRTGSIHFSRQTIGWSELQMRTDPEDGVVLSVMYQLPDILKS